MFHTKLMSHTLLTDDRRLASLLDQMGSGSSLAGPAAQAYRAEYQRFHETVIACFTELQVGSDGTLVVFHKNGRVQVWPPGDCDPSTLRKI